jgi:polynucleotide 5'-hydroxyl-kinase GRC3/NOL9
MDLDPGQPNYNLAGLVALLRMTKSILTNADFKDAEVVKGYYLNTPTPNLNMIYYLACTVKLLEDFKGILSEKKKVLIVNTCGWVDGLGADIQMKIVAELQPQMVVTMTKHN